MTSESLLVIVAPLVFFILGVLIIPTIFNSGEYIN